MANLFNHNLIKTHIQNHQIENFDEKLKVIQGWKKSIQMNKGVNEKALQSAFLQGIFGRCLGYKTFGDGDEWNLSIEVSTEVDATTPDGILGYYTADESITQAVIELKSPRHSLDKKQSRAGKDYGTPVDQAFSYASKYDRCSWVIVSNMNEIRLYKVGRSQEHYESFFIDDLGNIEEFKKFHLLLCKDNLIRRDGESPTYTLSEKTKERIQDISVSFYNLYKNIRIQLFEELKTSNPDYDNALLVEKAQKFLDRIIFICFCEDLGLLPNNLLHHAIQRGKDSYSDSEYVIWQEIRGVFRAIDAGSDKHNIPAYNGGLFAFDELLDNLSIKNDFFDAIYQISAYDFGTDLDVNILGHIFEQSITDIEELKADVQSEAYDPQKSRRKKDGIYYTPSYITKYIVENSLGKYLEDIRNSLGESDLPDIESATTSQLEGRYKKKLLQFYRDYEAKLQQVKVLDPACGSGAFLNQAFDFLLEEYRWIHSKLAELKEGQKSIFDSDAYQRSVLQDNLCGVDLNEESVEITKLSLWLKTADSRNALPYLDNNIKCGNSLIDDPEVAGDKAFKWDEEFPEIMADGGFNVVIGNPPYGAAFTIEEKKYLDTSYSFVEYNYDSYKYFMLLSLKVMANNSYMGLITPNTYLVSEQGCLLRKHLFSSTQIVVLVETFNVFSDAVVEPIITIIKKHSIEDKYKFTVMLVPRKLDFDNIYRLEGRINNFTRDDLFVKDNLVFNYRETERERMLCSKIMSTSKPLSDYAVITTGIKPYQKGKGSPPQTAETVAQKPFTGYKALSEAWKPLIRGKNVNRYTLRWDGEYIKYGSWLAEPRDSSIFNNPKLFIRRTDDNIMATYDDDNFIGANSVHSIQIRDIAAPMDLKCLLALINSKLTNWIFRHDNFHMVGKPFAEVKVVFVERLPIIKTDKSRVFAQKTDELLAANKLLSRLKEVSFMSYVYKYCSKSSNSLDSLTHNSDFLNLVYKGASKKIVKLKASINDKIMTLYSVDNRNNATELVKLAIDKIPNQKYLKLYLENLNEEQLADINQYSGNILDKVLQITIPDYDKPEVVRKVVNEWNQLQTEIAGLENKIEAIDKEIDQMVYKLYSLTEDEIKLVEGNVN